MNEPERLKQRPHHGRFPIPFVTHVENGVPNFRVHDNSRREECGKQSLCQLCGLKLLEDESFAFTGTEGSIERQTFGEPPAHRDCLDWAWEVCPFLAGADWRDEWKQAHREQFTILEPQPKARMGIYITDHYSLIPDDEGSGSIKWLAGPQLEEVIWR